MRLSARSRRETGSVVAAIWSNSSAASRWSVVSVSTTSRSVLWSVLAVMWAPLPRAPTTPLPLTNRSLGAGSRLLHARSAASPAMSTGRAGRTAALVVSVVGTAAQVAAHWAATASHDHAAPHVG